MGQIRKAKPVKLITGFIYNDPAVAAKAQAALAKKFGQIDFTSPEIPFTHTDYYTNEFGKGLKRKFFSFKKLIPPSRLAQIKISTNTLERKFAKNGLRCVNIDPGYLDLSKLVLASTKDYKHRIYLDKSIYAEITLFYQQNSFCGWDWTYPDYKTPEYIAVFNQIRGIYADQLKNI
jgi:hypothetical protein